MIDCTYPSYQNVSFRCRAPQQQKLATDPEEVRHFAPVDVLAFERLFDLELLLRMLFTISENLLNLRFCLV